jgi:shikimate kinase
VILVGLMGSGKTTVGRLLATRLGRPFLDSDEQVETRTGRTVREIFEHDGEAAFRRLEAAALAEAVACPTPSVIAAAGGVVLDPGNRALLRSAGTVVWLRAPARALVGRAQSGAHRPLLADDPEGVLSRMESERRPLYEAVADHVVDASDDPPGEVAAAIEALVA